jgi:hypothetical protein
MLSKSKIMRGKQCHKSLWLYKHQPELREISAGQEAIFQAGTDVGVLAQDLFLGGVDATAGHDYPNRQCAKKTLELIADGVEVIYEATFIFDDVLVAIDILAKVNGAWNIYEVKSTTKVKDPHIPDAAVQKYVAEGCGIPIAKVFLVHLNRDYVRQGELDIQSLFTKSEITEEVALVEGDIPDTIAELKAVQSQATMPEVNIGPHCSDPYGCDFMNHCWKHVPDYSVFNITRISSKAWDLYEDGVLEIGDVPDDFPLSNNQRHQVDIEKTGEDLIKPELIQDFLGGLSYPLYYLDFETFMPAVPLLDHTRPYDQIVFQYSLHIQHEPNGTCEHKEFLAEANGNDPRPKFIAQLLEDCGSKGSIIVYNQGFEVARMNELGYAFPEHQRSLTKLTARIADLMKPFQQFAFYKKEMHGSYSIKSVLPAIAPELSYKDLVIADGGTASTAFYSLFQGNYKGDVDTLRNDLLKYCERDTWAMVVLMGRLREIE